MYAFISGVSLTATYTIFMLPALNGTIDRQIDRPIQIDAVAVSWSQLLFFSFKSFSLAFIF